MHKSVERLDLVEESGDNARAPRARVRICLLSSMHPPRDKRVFDKEARSLAAAGYEVAHLCYSDKAESSRVDGVQIEAETRGKGFIRRAFSLIRLFRRAASLDADAYHCNEVDSWLVGLLLKLFRRRKIIFDVHEHYPSNFAEVHFPRQLHKPVAALIRLIFRVFTPFTDHFVFAKRSVAPDFPGATDKHTFVFNVSPLEYQHRTLEDVDSQIRERYVARRTLVHLGLYNRARGWPQILEALSQMEATDAHLLFIGELNDGSSREFAERVGELGLSERVEHVPWLPFREAYDFLLCSDVGLLLFQPVRTNYRFAFPHKMFDYMLAGLPIIVPEFATEVTTIVEEADCGLIIDTTSPREIARALDRLLSDQELARRLGANGRRAVLEKYNWEREFEKLLAMYDRSLLGVG